MVKYIRSLTTKYSPVALRQLAEVERRYVMFYVYSVYNQRHNKVYIGQTDNLDLRLKLHNNKEFKHSYTARFDGEWVLVYKEEVVNRAEALKREKQLKSFRGREFIKNIIHSPVAQR